jgi:hypothetical protein
MNQQTAFAMNALLEAIYSLSNEVLYLANNSGDEGLKQAAQSSLGDAVANLDLHLSSRIHREFPETKPASLDV